MEGSRTTPGIGARLRAAYEAVTLRTFVFTGSMCLAAASLIGFETLAVLLGYATAAPVTVPLIVAGIALVAVVRRRSRLRGPGR